MAAKRPLQAKQEDDPEPFPTDVNENMPGGMQDALVIDVSSVECRIGYSGYFKPQVVCKHGHEPYIFSDSTGLGFDEDELGCCIDRGLQAFRNFAKGKHGKLVDKKLLAHVFLVTPTQARPDMYLHVAQLLFERFNVASAYVARRATLSAYAHGLTTALVLDVGASHSCSALVKNGLVLQDRVFDSAVGGDLLDALLFEQLMGSPSRGPRLEMEQVRGLKKRYCRVRPAHCPSDTRFVLPDGTEICLAGREKILLDVPEFLFAPQSIPYPDERSLWRVHENARKLHFRHHASGQQNYYGLQFMLASTFATPPEVTVAGQRGLLGVAEKMMPIKDLGSQFVLTGGCTRILGFMSRLNDELLRTWAGQRLRKETDCKRLSFFGADRDERASALSILSEYPKIDHDAFAGGAIMASAAVPHWVTKDEYLDRGSTALSFHCG